jgi:acetyl/propionyl-CoA carboxylase alpha subunit
MRQQITAASLALAKAVGYTSAGTLEFVLTPDNKFYFLEMNTRLQVEHPVTELVTGIDLAAWQIRLAGGERLTFGQEDLIQRSHALECRIYAEDPADNFMPSIGEIAVYRPASGPGVRVDDGIEEGTQVSPYYDPMLAKIITWGDDRNESIRKMIRALQDTVILGVTTNIPYLVDILHHPEFVAGRLNTKFIEDYMEPWIPSPDTSNSTWLALATYEAIKERVNDRGSKIENSQVTGQSNPWSEAEDWRNVLGEILE